MASAIQSRWFRFFFLFFPDSSSSFLQDFAAAAFPLDITS